MKNKNYYEILEVSETATYDEIKRAYYKLAKQYHPDINPKMANVFKDINAAYSTLSNPVQRKEYDDSLKNADFDTEDIYTTDYTYYTDSTYYQDLSDEAIINIINDYAIKTAITAIWKRKCFAIFGNSIMYLLGCIFILFNRTYKLIARKSIKRKHYESPWWNWLIDTMQENKLLETIKWWGLLSLLFVAKIMYYILIISVWCFDKVTRYVLSPLIDFALGLFGIKIRR